MTDSNARPAHEVKQTATAHRERTETERAIVRYLRRDVGPAGMATAAIAHKVGVDTKTAGELLRQLERESVVEQAGVPGLGGGQWRLVGETDE